MIRWALADEFWSAVIQSPKKLRARWDQMTAQRRRRPGPRGGRPVDPGAGLAREAFDYRREAAANPSDRRTLDADGNLVDPEADAPPRKLPRPRRLESRRVAAAH
jgi:hypothetical protein